MNRLEHDSLLAIKWFKNSNMKLNKINVMSLVQDINMKTYFSLIDQSIIWEAGNQKTIKRWGVSQTEN